MTPTYAPCICDRNATASCNRSATRICTYGRTYGRTYVDGLTSRWISHQTLRAQGGRTKSSSESVKLRTLGQRCADREGRPQANALPQIAIGARSDEVSVDTSTAKRHRHDVVDVHQPVEVPAVAARPAITPQDPRPLSRRDRFTFGHPVPSPLLVDERLTRTLRSQPGPKTLGPLLRGVPQGGVLGLLLRRKPTTFPGHSARNSTGARSPHPSLEYAL